jgi:ribose/xylose/arabinose/galactoside ABC-type transport system permease subunit
MSESRSSIWNRSSLPFNEMALIVAIGAVFLLTGLADSNHAYFNNFQISAKDILCYWSIFGMLALGAAVVIIAGGIDLSIGATVAFGSVVCTSVMLAFAEASDSQLKNIPAYAVVLAFLATVLAGGAVGTLHTWLVTGIGLPPFIATLATLVGLRSFARVLTNYVWVLKTGSTKAQINATPPIFVTINSNVWIGVAVFALLAVLTWLLLSKTVLGRHTYALGGNEQAAKLSGIRTNGVKWFAYCYCSMMATIASIFVAANVGVAQPVNQAAGYELTAIAAAVVGGCSLKGGVGRVTGVVLGALFMRLVIDSIQKLIKSNADVYEGIIVGVVVALAVAFAQLQELRQSQREFFPGVRGLAAIATLTLGFGLFAAMIASSMKSPVPSPYVGLGVGLLVGAICTAIRVWESRRRTAA